MAVSIILVAIIAAVSAQNPPVVNSVPINGLTAAVCAADERTLVADAQSKCYFYACTVGANGAYRLTPKRCGLGSYVHSDFTSGLYNPCTQRFPIMGMYNCTRTPDSGCETVLNCTNGATLLKEGNLCWCNCSLEWQGSPDCSVRKNTTPLPPLNTLCPNGEPLQNWCNISAPNTGNPCLNGGICINQCTNFVCNCTVPNVKDKLCGLYPS